MELAESKQLNYLNYDENIEQTNFPYPFELMVNIELSLKVQI